MFGVSGELAFLAEECGATRAVLFDAMDPSDAFVERHERTSSRVQFYQGDLHDPEAVAALGSFDVVWCSGVLYHSPNPLQQLMHLRSIMNEVMVLGNLIIPEIPNFENACIFYPGISEETQARFAKQYGGADRFPGMSTPFDTLKDFAFANMWWGFSPSAIRSMMRFTGLDITEEYRYAAAALDVVARPGGIPLDIYPPEGFYRNRALDRHGSTPPDQVPSYATEQMELLRKR
jgi:SAM-dependent methyltransferase